MKAVQVYEGDGVAEHYPPQVMVACHFLKFIDMNNTIGPWLWLSGWSERHAAFSALQCDAVPIPLAWSQSIGAHIAVGHGPSWRCAIVNGICAASALAKWPEPGASGASIRRKYREDRQFKILMGIFASALSLTALGGCALGDVLNGFPVWRSVFISVCAVMCIWYVPRTVLRIVRS